MKYIPYIKSINKINLDILKEVKLKIERRFGMNMKFIKGVVVGGLITTGVMMMWSDNSMINTKKMTKKGKQFAKKMGII